MLGRNRSVLENVALGDGDGTREVFLAPVHAHEHGGYRQYFERAAHGERLVEAISGHLAAFTRKQTDADSTAAFAFDLGQAVVEYIACR